MGSTGWWQQVTPCTTAERQSTRVSDCSLVPDSRLPSGPLLVETGIGSLLTRSLVSRVRLLERSVTKRTPINAICSGTDNDVFTLNVQGQLIWTKRWLDGTVEHESMGTRHDNRALAARLADFLQVAYRQYQSTLWKYHRDRLVEVG
ncbi:hypothetical protein BASA81_012966 [Batrachochytrium salamandrivorans]|nr:hypothetical protein BASA81_012966 [Batrachochytrium salamandrivorans]